LCLNGVRHTDVNERLCSQRPRLLVFSLRQDRDGNFLNFFKTETEALKTESNILETFHTSC